MPDELQVFSYQGAALDAPDVAASWGALWDQSLQRSPFSALAYARAFADVLTLDLHLVGVQHTDGQWLAAALLPVRRRGPFQQVVLAPFTPFSAVLCAAPLDEAHLHHGTSPWQTLCTDLVRRFDHIPLHLPPSIQDVRSLRWQGWTVTPYYTYLLDLCPPADLYQPWSASTRRLFRNEQDHYRVSEQPDVIKAVVDLCDFAYERHERSLLLAPERLARIAQRLQQAGHVRTFIARNTQTNQIDAGVCVLHDDRTAYYWIAGSRPGAAMTVLLGKLLPQLQAEGFQAFDFVGANTPSIAEFKRRFGAVLTTYYHAETIPNRLLRLMYALRRFM